MKRLQLGKTAFLLCDIQEKFRPLIHAFPSVVSTAQKMISASHILQAPLLATEQSPSKLGSTVKELDLSSSVLNADKTRFSMCVPSLKAKISELGVDSIVLFGIESHVCVTQTALDCLEQKLHTVILADGVSSMNKWEKKIAIERLRAEGAVISSSESVLFELMRDASHPQFRQISSLVKETKASTDKALEELVGYY